MKTIKYGIVGTGYFGAELGRILNRLEGAQVTTVYDTKNTYNIAKELKCEVASSIEDLCSSQDVDTVIVASPNGMHKEPVLLAAKYKKNVFCEKPIALNLQDCKEMVEETTKQGVLFMAGHIMNFMNGARRAKRFINDGIIGDVLFCHAERNGWEEAQASVSWKKKRDISGGHLYHHIHELDFIQFIMGSAERVCMTGGNVAHVGEQFGDEDDMLFITLEFPNNRYATLQYGSAFRWSDHFVKIQGTKGAILLDMQDAKMVLKTEEKEETLILHESQEEDNDRSQRYRDSEMDGAIMYGRPTQQPPQWLRSMMINEIKYLHSVQRGKEIDEEFMPLLNGSAAKNSIATADALTLSLSEDRKVSVKEIYENL